MSWNKLNPKTKPSKRSSHTSWKHDNKMYIFGGLGKYRTNDLFFYDPQQNNFFEIKQKGDIPSPRCKMSGIIIKNKNALYTFGGWAKRGEKKDDMHIYDFNSGIWNQIKNQKGRIPSKRSAHSCFMNKKKYIYLFGGIGGNKYNDMYQFDLRNNNWINVNQKNPPGKRSSYGGFHKYNEKYYIVCGLGAGKFNDCWSYDVKDCGWEKMKYEKGNEVPYPRGRHSAVLYNDKVYMFGGWLKKTKSDELWVLDLKQKNWQKIKQENKPSKREAHSAELFGNQMWLFGGWNENGDTENSLYHLDMSQFDE